MATGQAVTCGWSPAEIDLRVLWPVAVLVVAGALLWTIVRALAAGRARRRARWVQITFPEGLGARQVTGLWRLLGGILPAARWWRLRPGHLVVELWAYGDQVRCGLWLPPAVHVEPTMRAIVRAWPGAHVRVTDPPDLPTGRQVVGRRLRYRESGFDAVRDDTRLDPAAMPGRQPARIEDAHAVLDALTTAGHSGVAVLQLVVARPTTSRLNALRAAAAGERAGTPLLGAVGRVPLIMLQLAVEVVIDLLSPGPARDAARGRAGDDHAAGGAAVVDPALVRTARAKLAAAPHFLVDIRTTVAARSRGTASTFVADISRGYAALTHAVIPIPWWPAARATARRPAPGRWAILATAAETAALTPIPTEPALYGMPTASGRHRPATTGLWSPAAGTWSDPTEAAGGRVNAEKEGPTIP
ncbi:hypothetical protein [Fodinicola acaciae]|uniref:hypothetical protein n=1 Tax=Fodinicola acaciae TaxID=2681555 RepID=UPI0013D490E9|nr:hypothetical protein [Fodinicola acaciae]